MKSKPCQILRILLSGREIAFKDWLYPVCIENGQLCWVYRKEPRHLLGCDLTITNFIKECEKIDEETIFLLMAGLTIQEYNMSKCRNKK